MVTLLRNRRGAGTLGCLFSLLIFAAMLFYGYHIGRCTGSSTSSRTP